MPLTLTKAQVAAELHLSPRRFTEKRAELEAAGFPKPLPVFDRPRWSRAAVKAWVDDDQKAPATANIISLRYGTGE